MPEPQIGKHWLLLRGLCREAGHWGEFPQLLQAAFPKSTVNTLDLPGTGEDFRGVCPASIEAITDELRRRATNKKLLDAPPTLLAVSLGGMVAWDWLIRHPNEVAGCALLNTSLASLSPFHQRLRWQNYRKVVGLLATGDLRQRELAIVELVSNRRERHADTAANWEKIQQERPIGLGTVFRQILAAARYRPEDQRPNRPMLLLAGRGDRLVAPACSEAIRDKWQIDLDQHPWAGHDLTLDDPDWVIGRLLAWSQGKTT